MEVTDGNSKPEVTYRLATTADADAISALVGRVWADHFAFSVSPADLATFLATSLAPTSIASTLEDANIRYPLALRGDVLVGVAQLVIASAESCVTSSKPAELRKLYVDTSLHGGGIARILVERTEEMARDEGRDGLWLGVWEANDRGKRFYEKMGFEVKGEHSFLVGESVRRDWIMEKTL